MKKHLSYLILIVLMITFNSKQSKAQIDSLGFALWIEQPSVSGASINNELASYYAGIADFVACNPGNVKINKVIVRFLDRNYAYTDPKGNPFKASKTSPFYTQIITKLPAGVDVYILPWIKDWPNVNGKSKIEDMMLTIKDWNAVINDPSRQIKGIVMEGEGAGALLDVGWYKDYKGNLVNGMLSPQQAANTYKVPLGLEYVKIGVTLAGNNLGDPSAWGVATDINHVDECYLQVYNMYDDQAGHPSNAIYVDAFDFQKDGTCQIGGRPIDPYCNNSIYLEALKNTNPAHTVFEGNTTTRYTFKHLLTNPHFAWNSYTILVGGAKYIYPMFSIEANKSRDGSKASCIFPNTNDPNKCGQIDAFGSWKPCDYLDFVDEFSNNQTKLTKFANPAERIPKTNFGIFQYALLPKSWVYYTPPTFKTTGPVKVCDKASIQVNIVECMYYQLYDTKAKKYYGTVGGITRTDANSTSNYNNFNKIADAGVYTIDNVDAGTYTIRIFSNPLKKETCFSESATTITVIKNGPTVSIAASPGKNICEGEALTLTASSPTGVSYTWTPNSAINGQAFTPLMNGLYTVTAKDAQNCTSIDTISIRLNSFSVGKDSSICASSIGLNATLPTGATGEWTVKSGSGTFADKTNKNTTVSGLATGKNEFTWSIKTGTCAGTSKTTTITKNASQATPNAGLSTQINVGDIAYLNAGGLNAGELGEWTISPIKGIIANKSLATTNITGLPVGKYIVKWTVTGTCGSAEDTLTITVNGLPTGILTGSATICAGSTASLKVDLTGVAPWSITYTDGSTPQTIHGILASPYTLMVNPSTVKTYTLTAITDKNSTGTVSGSAQIDIITLPNALIQNTGNELGYCAANNGLTLIGNAISGAQKYAWLKDGIALGLASSIHTKDNATAGVWKLILSSGSCVDTSEAVTVFIQDNPSITLTALPDSSVCLDEMLTLKGNSTLLGTTFSWNNGVTDGLAFKLDNVSKFQTYTLTATSLVGCTATLSVTLKQKSPTHIISNPIGVDACVGDNKTLSVLASGDGTLHYEWFKDNLTIGNNSNQLILNGLTAAEAGTYKVTVTGNCGSFNSTDAVVSIKDKPIILTQPTKSGGCVGSAAGLTVLTNGGNAYTYQWIKLPNTKLGGNTANISFTPLAQADTGVYKVEISNTCGLITSDTASIVMPLDEVPTVALIVDKTAICEGNNVLLTAVIKQGGGSNPMYTFKDGLGNVIGLAGQAANTTSTANLTTTQTYTVEMMSNSTCLLAGAANPAISNSIVVKVDQNPTAVTAGMDQNICMSTYTLAASDPLSGVGVWTVKSGAGNFSNSNSNTSLVNAIGIGINEYTWTVTNGVCGAVSKTVIITRKSTLQTPFAGIDMNACVGVTVNLNATALGNDENGIWTISPNTANITAETNPMSSISNLAKGTYQVKWTISNGVCNHVADSLVLTVNDQPNTSFAIVGDSIGCVGATIQENIPFIPGATSYVWTLNNATGHSTTNLLQAIIGSDTNATITVAGVNECGTGVSVSKKINIKSIPTLAKFSADNNPTKVCSNTEVVYQVDTIAGETYTWSWKNGLNKSNVVLQHGSISTKVGTINTPTVDTLMVKASNSCGAGPSQHLAVIFNPLPRYAMPNDTMVCEGNTLPDLRIELSGKPTYILQYTLNATPYTVTTSSNNYVIAKAAIGNYQVLSLTDANGCANTNPSTIAKVQQIASPRFDYTISAGAYCSGETATLHQSGSEAGIVYNVYQKEGVVSTKLSNYTGNGNAMTIALTSTSLHNGNNILQVVALGCVNKTFTDTALVTMVGNPLAIIGNAWVCDNNHTNLTYSIAPIQGVEAYKWHIDKASATIVGADNKPKVQLTLGQDNRYTLSVMAMVNGQACMSTSASLTINQQSAYKGDTLVLSKDSICSEDYASLHIPTQTAISYQHWVFPEGTIVSTTDSINFELQCFHSGTITVQPTDACASTISPLTKAMVVYQKPVAFAGENIHLKGYPMNLALQGENNTAEPGVKYTYQWHVSKGTAELVGANTLSPAVHPKVVETSYVLSINTPSNTCSAADSVRVSFEIPMSPPLIFSPNGDGKNDFWMIEGIEYFPNASIEIFNQWGLKVYAKTGDYLASPWDGGDLPIATYYYTIVPNVPGLESTVGSVTLVR